MQPEYIEIGEPRHGLWPADKRRELDSVYGREKRRGTVVRLGNEKPHLTEKERQRTAEHRNIFGGLRRVEGWLLKQVSLGMGTAWRPFYFRLSELHGGSLEYDRQPLCHPLQMQPAPHRAGTDTTHTPTSRRAHTAAAAAGVPLHKTLSRDAAAAAAI